MSEEQEELPQTTEAKPEMEQSEPKPENAEPEPEKSAPEPEKTAAKPERLNLPGPSTAPQTNFNEHEFITEQFENYLRIAQALMKTLKRPKDIEICTNLMRKVQRLNDSKHLEVKRNNNAFFRYCLKVLKWTSDNQPERLYKCLYNHKDTPEAITESRTWFEDNKSYEASKVYKDGIKLMYVAVAEDPSLGWQDGGLNILARRGSCDRF